MRELIRKNQDTIFSSLYSDPECVLDLYYTLHPEDRNQDITLDQLQLITLENAFLVQRYNDVAFQIGDRLIVLVEHQSTINENMPLRMLFYVANEYEKIISSIKKKLYQEKRVTIPKPEFFVIYTGQKTWKHKELRLSEAYGATAADDIPLEVWVRVICENDLQGMQNTLSGYYHFIRFIKDNTVNGKISTDSIENYIRQFKGSELFKKFLEKLSTEEVIKMLDYEFDLNEAKEAWKEEAMEEGMERGMERGREESIEEGIRSLMTNLKLSLNQAMDALSIPVEKQAIYAARIQKQ